MLVINRIQASYCPWQTILPKYILCNQHKQISPHSHFFIPEIILLYTTILSITSIRSIYSHYTLRSATTLLLLLQAVHKDLIPDTLSPYIHTSLISLQLLLWYMYINATLWNVCKFIFLFLWPHSYHSIYWQNSHISLYLSLPIYINLLLSPSPLLPYLHLPLTPLFPPTPSAPLLELAQDEKVRSKIEEAGKLFFSSDTVTINLIPVLIGAALLGLLLIPLFALLFQPAAETTEYGPPVSEYGAPSAGYGAPEYRSVSYMYTVQYVLKWSISTPVLLFS